MDRGNVLSGAAFSAVLMSAVTFVIMLITIGFITHSYVERSGQEELREDIETRWFLFAADYRDEGVGPLTGLIESAARFTAQDRRAIGLFDADGTPVAGNILTRPQATGWQQAPLDVARAAERPRTEKREINYLYRSGPLDGFTLIVGQRMDRMFVTNRAVFRTLAITGFVVVLTMLSFGYLLSRKSLRKLEQLEATLAQVSDGDLSARMVLSPANDQIDRIAGRMNAHLDTLSRLMISTRCTAAAVAHDLKSPLARAYLGLGRALARLEAGKDPRAEIEDTQAELEGMNRIFDTFLRLARIEAGADGAQFAKIDLGALLGDLAETYQMMAEDHGQRLVFDRPQGQRFEITGDASMLQQMVANLLENAVSHGGNGNMINLRLDRAADHVRLTLTDTGPGIPEAAREAVFEPFSRLDHSRRKPGNGLGLALVRAIAERHGALITLSDNTPGLRVVVEFRAAI